MTTKRPLTTAQQLRAAKRVRVNVNGRDDNYYVQTTKAEARYLLSTKQFRLTMTDGTAYIDIDYKDPDAAADGDARVTSFATIRDLAADLADSLGLDPGEVLRTLELHRHQVPPYEAIDRATHQRLARLVWDEVTGGAEWPW